MSCKWLPVLTLLPYAASLTADESASFYLIFTSTHKQYILYSFSLICKQNQIWYIYFMKCYILQEICISYLDECSRERSRHSRQKFLRLDFIVKNQIRQEFGHLASGWIRSCDWLIVCQMLSCSGCQPTACAAFRCLCSHFTLLDWMYILSNQNALHLVV